MEKYLIILILPMICACTSDRGSNKCLQFKTGDYTIYEEEDTTTYYIHRNDSVQTERNSKTNFTRVTKVVWVSDCEYNLYKTKADGLYPKVDSLRKDKPLRVVITKVANDYYIFEAKVDGIPFNYSDTAFKSK